MGWKPEVWVAIYAACVATGALLLQLRSWVVSGPRLRVSVISNGLIIGGGPEFDEDDLVIVNVTNVGTAATMITNLMIEERFPFYYFWRRLPINIHVVLNPHMKGYPRNVPHLLEPAHQWTGIIRNRPDILLKNLRDGDHYAAIHTSNRKRPYRRRIAPVKPASLKRARAS